MFLRNELIINVLLGVDGKRYFLPKEFGTVVRIFSGTGATEKYLDFGKRLLGMTYYRIKETSLKRYCRFSPFSVSMTNSPSGNTPVIFPRKVPETSL